MFFGSHVVPEELKRIFEVTVDGAVPGGLDPQEEAALECLKALRQQVWSLTQFKFSGGGIPQSRFASVIYDVVP